MSVQRRDEKKLSFDCAEDWFMLSDQGSEGEKSGAMIL